MNCPGCELPLIEGQVMNGLLQCHWDCQDATREKIGNDVADILIQQRINKRLYMDGIDPTHHLWKTLGGSL